MTSSEEHYLKAEDDLARDIAQIIVDRKLPTHSMTPKELNDCVASIMKESRLYNEYIQSISGLFRKS